MLHGETKPVSFSLQAERTASGVEVQGEIPITFSNWGIGNPSFGGFVTVGSSGTMEFLLHLAKGATSTATASPTTVATAPPSGGGFSMPTVPKNTVPPLTIAGSGG